MKKMCVIGLLALMSVGGMSCVYARASEDTVPAAVSGASPGIAQLCAALDQTVELLKTNSSDVSGIGSMIEKKANELDPNQKLTPADKALLKKTMCKLMETVVTTKVMENPQMASLFGNLSEDQKKEMVSMAMEVTSKEIDSKIDQCDTIGDFVNMDI